MTPDTVTGMPRAELLTLLQVAALMRELSGTSTPTDQSIRVLHKRAQKRRAAGTPRSTDLPAPDRVVGQSPAWYRSTIVKWWAKERA